MSAPDPARIYLEPGEGGDEGRTWRQDNVWHGEHDYADLPPATEYVRADLVANPPAEVRQLRSLAKARKDQVRTLEERCAVQFRSGLETAAAYLVKRADEIQGDRGADTVAAMMARIFRNEASAVLKLEAVQALDSVPGSAP